MIKSRLQTNDGIQVNTDILYFFFSQTTDLVKGTCNAYIEITVGDTTYKSVVRLLVNILRGFWIKTAKVFLLWAWRITVVHSCIFTYKVSLYRILRHLVRRWGKRNFSSKLMKAFTVKSYRTICFVWESFPTGQLSKKSYELRVSRKFSQSHICFQRQTLSSDVKPAHIFSHMNVVYVIVITVIWIFQHGLIYVYFPQSIDQAKHQEACVATVVFILRERP